MTVLFLFAALSLPTAAADDIPDQDCHHELEAGHTDAASLYDLTARFVDQTGKPAELDAPRGHPVVVSMFYGSCARACPLIIQNMKDLDASLPAGTRPNVRYVLVTFDPARDTAAVLAGLVGQHSLDNRWTLLAGDENATREIAAALGVKYRQRPDGDFDHSTGLAVLDGGGVIVARTADLSVGTDALAAAILTASTP